IAALIGATAFTVWAQSVVNEKVYTVSLLGLALVSWLTVRWCDDPDGPEADRLLVMIAYLSGLGYANHMAGFLAVPAVAVAVALRTIPQPSRTFKDSSQPLPFAPRPPLVSSIEARSQIVFLFWSADVHGHRRPRLLHEFQIRRVAVAGIGRHRPARGARPRLLLFVELLRVERVGRARSCFHLGDNRRTDRLGEGARGQRDARPSKTT